MQKTVSIITAVLILIVVSTTSAHADRKTMERIMFGTGAAILGAAIIHGIHNNSGPRYISNTPWHDNQHYDRYRHGDRKKHHKKYKHGDRKRHHKRYSHNRHRGHWETQKIWVEPVYETKWNPGHYNRRGRWVNGRYEKYIVTRGCWQKNKIWIWH